MWQDGVYRVLGENLSGWRWQGTAVVRDGEVTEVGKWDVPDGRVVAGERVMVFDGADLVVVTPFSRHVYEMWEGQGVLVCGADTYRVQLFLGAEGVGMVQEIVGPHKNERLSWHYTKVE